MTGPSSAVPEWLLKSEQYEPIGDNDRFIGKSMLSITGVLANFRLDDGRQSRVSPSAPVKLIFGLAVILLTSLSTNYFYVLVVLACLLVRQAFLPGEVLKRTIAVSLVAAGLTFLIMLPAIFIGQSHSAVLIATKVFVSVGTAMTVALTTPYNQMTAALRVFHVPNLFIMTIDLALKSIVRLGRIALQMLEALQLRSVGRNQEKGKAVGGIGGTIFLKTSEAASVTYDAMCCRGFEGDYPLPKERQWRAVDLVWLAALALLIVLFVYLQGVR